MGGASIDAGRTSNPSGWALRCTVSRVPSMVRPGTTVEWQGLTTQKSPLPHAS